MRHLATDTAKEKLPMIENITISVKKKSDNIGKVATGLAFDRILLQLAKSQEISFFGKENNYEKLNTDKGLILNSLSPNAVGCAKISSTFSAELNKNECGTTKIRECHSFGKQQKYSRFLKHSFNNNEPCNGPKKANNTNNYFRKEKTESEFLSKTNFELLVDRVERKKNEINQSHEGHEFSKKIKEPVSIENKKVENSNSRICVIQKVSGNELTTFSSSDAVTLKNDDEDDYNDNDDDDIICLDPKETQVIVPKKTDDITKIKGWRRKQFFVEKPTTVEFSFDGTLSNNKSTERSSSNESDNSSKDNVENAFVCKSLDEFLEKNVQLKINYEVPHLFAEFGITLTKEDLASTPTLSEESRLEVETKYCTFISNQIDTNHPEDVNTEKTKKAKREAEDEGRELFKVIKLEHNTVRLVKETKNSPDKEQDICNENLALKERNLEEKNENDIKSEIKDSKQLVDMSNTKLTSKVLGLVVYPSPEKPLHPIVQFHLKKLRSYRTVIDSHWANFAASVVLGKDSKYQRFILPATCCVKVIKDSVSANEKITTDSFTAVSNEATKEEDLSAEKCENTKKPEVNHCPLGLSITGNFSVKELKKMKECKVLVKKINIKPGTKVWCLKHYRFKCESCNCVKKPQSILKPVTEEKTRKFVLCKPKESEKSVLRSSEPNFYEDVAVLLTEKVKEFHPDSSTNIDSLKNLFINTVELIKLKVIQKCFSQKGICIWYLKPQKTNLKARAILTFSKLPPVPNAINLRCGLFVKNLPKVVREIVETEKQPDPNEYALLYCNGEYWEIYGSVNVTFNKCVKSSEQIGIPYGLSELRSLRDLSFKILKTKAAKWWVLDTTQQFQIIELKSNNIVSKILQNTFLAFTKLSTNSGFVPLLNSRERVFGLYVIQNLLPYVLIGPYYLFEIINVNLKEDFSFLPFMYNEVKDSKETKTLQFHISTVIKSIKESGKRVEGLWLHVRTVSEHSCFVEVLTAVGVNSSFQNNYSIADEHGYSLSSACNPRVNRENSQSGTSKVQVEVYLYFDIFGLGYVLGVLEEDNSVTINHPLNEQTKVNSTEIGNWFLGVVRRKIQFIPENLVVNWFITTHKSLLRNRQPFNKNFLNGAHILTGSGVFYVLKLHDSIHQGDNRKQLKNNHKSEKNYDAAAEEIIYLKVLSKMLVGKLSTKPRLDQILTLAVNEIRKLEEEVRLLNRIKECLEEEKLKLFNSYLIAIDLKGLNKELSLMLLNRIQNLFFRKSGEISESIKKLLESYSFGRCYLKSIEKRKLVESDEKASSNNTFQ